MNESHINDINQRLATLTLQERMDLITGIDLKAALVIQKLFPGVPFAEDLVKQKSGN